LVRALERKLLRDLRRIWAQTVAIALVLACGVMVMVAAQATQRALLGTQAAYYERFRFADIFAGLTRAPRALLADIAALPGVAQAEGRISFHAVLDIAGMEAPAMGRILSLPPDPALNLPLLRRGALPDPDRLDQVALSEPFATANGLVPGSRFQAVLNGQLRTLEVSGWVLSPEFIYSVAPGMMMPDDRRFGLIWMNEEAAAALMDMAGAFNDLSVRLARGGDARAVIAALDQMLAPYGGAGAQGRAQQTSHAFLDSELQQLGALALYLPPVFLLVSGFLVNMVLARLIAIERPQIGLLRALGYRRREIGAYYLKLAGLIGAVGVVLGWAMGRWLGAGMLAIYADFFRFPFLLRDPAFGAMALSGALGMAAALLGALRAVGAAMRLSPAEAMQPPTPPNFARGYLDRKIAALRLRQTSMMILRSLLRWPGRAMITLSGVALSVAVLVASYFIFDAVDLIHERVFDQSNRQQITLALARPAPARAVEDARVLPGVLASEGAFGVPVRLVHGHRSHLTALQAQYEGTSLARVIDDYSGPIVMPPSGLVLPDLVARKLGVGPGDLVQAELLAPPRSRLELPVARVIHQSFGAEAHIAASVLFAEMGIAPQVSHIHLRIDPDQMPALQARIKTLPAISGLSDWQELRSQFAATIDESLLTMAMIYTVIGVLIAIGVIYNAARIQVSERLHELATLRVLGFRRAEVGFVLVGEMMLLTLLALPLGWGLGYQFAQGMVAAISTDVVQMPFTISRRTFALASVVVVAAALGAVLLVQRRVGRVDLVLALKARE
jgi:putative ABC transport system permease protein